MKSALFSAALLLSVVVPCSASIFLEIPPIALIPPARGTGQVFLGKPSDVDTTIILASADPAITLPSKVIIKAGRPSNSFPIASHAFEGIVWREVKITASQEVLQGHYTAPPSTVYAYARVYPGETAPSPETMKPLSLRTAAPKPHRHPRRRLRTVRRS